MITATVLIGIAAMVALTVGGYLLGLGRGRRLRDALRQEIRRQQTELQSLQDQLQRQQPELQSLQEKLQQRQTEVNDLHRRLSDQAASGAAASDDGSLLRTQVAELLNPLVEQRRREGELARLGASVMTRGDLPRLLDTIAGTSGFSSVMVADSQGLPLATSKDANDIEELSWVSAMMLSLADRITKTGQPRPVALAIHDQSNRTMLHRIFDASGERFLLTAMARGVEVPLDSLDPTLNKLEQLLAARLL